MYGYKCDKCGILLNIDPNEKRICDQCAESMRQSVREPEKIKYQFQKGKARYVS